MILLLEYFEPDSKNRADEIVHCLRENAKNVFDHIVVFTQSKVKFIEEIPKCKVVMIHERSTYQSIFDWCNENISTPEVFVLSNSDILFNDTIDRINNIRECDFYCISRYEMVDGNLELHHSAMCSQDVWVWRNKCKIDKAYFNMGIPGCDNRIANIAGSVGYVLLNPSKSIVCEHVHSSDIRSYSDRVMGEYTYVNPCNIHEKETGLTKSHSGPKTQ